MFDLGLEFNEAFWNLIRGNIQTFEDVIIWQKISYDKINPIIDDKDLMKVAIKLFPKDDLSNNTWGIWTKKIMESSKFSGKSLFLPLRKAITGVEYGPELKFLLPLLGKKKILSRLEGKIS